MHVTFLQVDTWTLTHILIKANEVDNGQMDGIPEGNYYAYYPKVKVWQIRTKSLIGENYTYLSVLHLALLS